MNDVVMIKLDRPRELRYGHKAMKTLEEITGKSIDEIDQNMNLLSADVREKVVYCGLLKDAKDNSEQLTLEKVADLLDEAPHVGHILESVGRAWRVAFGLPADLLPEGNLQPAETPESESRTTGPKASA